MPAGSCLGHVLSRQGSPHLSVSPVSDYVIDDKVAVLQKRDHEGFGFVLRGAKGNGGGYPAGKGCTPLGVSSVSCLCSSSLLSSCRAPAPPSSPPPASSLPAVTLCSWFGMLVGGSGSFPSLVPRISAVRV